MSDFDFWHIGFQVSHHSTCVGNWTRISYRPCPGSEKVSQGSQCPACARQFMPVPECLFEPRCDGEMCNFKFCEMEHSIYVAFHGNITKVGMTVSERLRERMIEQGADAFLVVTKLQGRKSARELESKLAEKLAIRQRIRVIESLAMLKEPIPYLEIEAAYSELAEKLEVLGFNTGPLKFLEGYPIKQPLREMPAEARVQGAHVGKPLGVKGKIFVYENAGLKALCLQSLPGRHITRN
jgi:hypothetical protein